MRRGLQVFVFLLGVVAVVAGLDTVVRGADGVLDHGEVSASVDSELRFYAAWYVLVGVTMLQASRNVERQTTVIRAVMATLFLAACGRVISLATVDTPHVFYVVLMVVEFALPVIVIPWHAAVVRAHLSSLPPTAPLTSTD
jgi:hypothetical protein